jgi:hypothetical protein
MHGKISRGSRFIDDIIERSCANVFYSFLCKIGTNVCDEILGNKKLQVLMERLDYNYINRRFLQKLFYKSFSW